MTLVEEKKSMEKLSTTTGNFSFWSVHLLFDLVECISIIIEVCSCRLI